jgi:hypothetical protein
MAMINPVKIMVAPFHRTIALAKGAPLTRAKGQSTCWG